MRIYILTNEPYHDNSTIIGVYLDEVAAVDAWKSAVNPADINSEDMMVTEWDLGANRAMRLWRAIGGQVSDPTKPEWHPIRRDYKFEGPIDA